jgi:hypothetical protein
MQRFGIRKVDYGNQAILYLEMNFKAQVNIQRIFNTTSEGKPQQQR